MFGDRITYRVHAVQRMFERKIAAAHVVQVLRTGEALETRPDDLPYPSRLVLGFVERAPFHVVAAYNEADDRTIVITVYRPDPRRWSADFRTRS